MAGERGVLRVAGEGTGRMLGEVVGLREAGDGAGRMVGEAARGASGVGVLGMATGERGTGEEGVSGETTAALKFAIGTLAAGEAPNFGEATGALGETTEAGPTTDSGGSGDESGKVFGGAGSGVGGTLLIIVGLGDAGVTFTSCFVAGDAVAGDGDLDSLICFGLRKLGRTGAAKPFGTQCMKSARSYEDSKQRR